MKKGVFSKITLTGIADRGSAPQLPERPLIERHRNVQSGDTSSILRKDGKSKGNRYAPADTGVAILADRVDFTDRFRDPLDDLQDAPLLDDLTFDHTDYESATLTIDLLEVHVPVADEAKVTVTSSFTRTTGGGISFNLPGNLLNVGASGKLTLKQQISFNLAGCARLKLTYKVTLARHYYRHGGASDADVVVTLLHSVNENRGSFTDKIADCPCHTGEFGELQPGAPTRVSENNTTNIEESITKSLDLTAKIGFGPDGVPVFSDKPFLKLEASAGTSQTYTLSLSLPGPHTYTPYPGKEGSGVLYWRVDNA